MKRLLYSLTYVFLGLTPLAVQAQEQEPDTAWKKGGVFSLSFTNSGYSNYWQAGGIPSLAIGARVSTFANFIEGNHNWQNDLDLVLGTIRQGKDGDFIKNDDRIELNSKYGYKVAEKLLVSGLLNFRTQFLEGFKFDGGAATLTPIDTISAFFSPAYLNFGIGIDYQPSENLSIYYTPINSKLTIVSNEAYRPIYIPQDITTGAVRYELGSLMAVKYRRQVMENILFSSKANFFTNYLEKFGNIDVNWETLTTMQVNKYIAVSFATNLIYDDDIKFDIDDNEDGVAEGKGPRTQFQHVLSVGFTYNFLQ